MDLGKIKNLVKQNGDKFVFVENGEPELVMMSFREYEKLSQRDPNLRMPSELSESSRSSYSDHSDDEFGPFGSQACLEETEFITPVAAGSSGLPIRLEDIRLEDLPV